MNTMIDDIIVLVSMKSAYISSDEFHHILNCPYLKQYRDIYIKKRYTKRLNIINFLWIVASKNILNLTNLCKFIWAINERVCPPG